MVDGGRALQSRAVGDGDSEDVVTSGEADRLEVGHAVVVGNGPTQGAVDVGGPLDGEARRFVSVYEEYAKAKDVTRKRLFLETMEDVLTNSNKVIIEGGQGGSGVVPYLPLPEVQKRRTGGSTQ